MGATALKWALAVTICWAAYQSWLLRELKQPPGVLVKEEPLQLPVEGSPKTFQHDEYKMEALAAYRIRGRLLHRERYRWGAVAGVSQLDFGLGWGAMSDTQVLEQLEFSQSGRFLFWRWKNQSPMPVDELNTHASNTHLIAADDHVFSSLNKMREGQLVELAGFLVKVSGPGGFLLPSSMVRNDTGAGACEVMYVESAKVI